MELNEQSIYRPFRHNGNSPPHSSSPDGSNRTSNKSRKIVDKKSIIRSIIGGFERLFSRKSSISRRASCSSPILMDSRCDTTDSGNNTDDDGLKNTEISRGQKVHDHMEEVDAIFKQHSGYIANQFKDFFSTQKKNINQDAVTFGHPAPSPPIIKERSFSYPWLPPESWAVVHLEDVNAKKSYSSRMLDLDHLNLLNSQLKDEYLDSYNSSPKIVSSSEISLPLYVDTQIHSQPSSYVSRRETDIAQKYIVLSTKKTTLPDADSEFTSSTLPDSDAFATTCPVWWIRVWKPLRRSSLPCQSPSLLSTNSGDLSSFSTMPFGFVTVSCPLNINTKELISVVSSKFSNPLSSTLSTLVLPSVGELYVIHRGVARILHPNDRPIRLQKQWFEQLGYSGLAKLSNLGLQDHSYVCQFIYFDAGDASSCLSLLSNEAHLSGSSIFPTSYEVTPDRAILPARNLLVLPVKLFQFVSSIEILDISRNPMISIPTDFIQSCSNLQTIILSSCELDMVPRSIPFCSTLTTLILKDNLLKEDALDCLCLLKNLEVLDLTANYLTYLPLSLVTLTKLKSLNLSSNGITTLPSVLFHLKSLEFLDLSFNFITSLQEDICSLENLKTLILAYNRIKVLEPQLSNLSNLKHIDIKGNNISDINILLSSGSLSSINAQYNSISKLQLASPEPCLCELNLDNNSLSSIEVPPSMSTNFLCFHTLTELLICSSKLVSLPDALFVCCPNITRLRLDSNQLKELPSTLGNLAKTLVSLSISHNKLTSLPSSIGLLKKLAILDLHGNNLTSLSTSILSCSRLSILNVSSNLLSSLPSLPLRSANELGSDGYPKLQVLNARYWCLFGILTL